MEKINNTLLNHFTNFVFFVTVVVGEFLDTMDNRYKIRERTKKVLQRLHKKN